MNDHPENPQLPGQAEGRADKDGKLRALLERDSRFGAVGTGEEKAPHPGRVLVRVTSVRKRLIDEDNICVKYCVDCLRYAGLIPDDNPAKVKIETGQRKVAKGEEEHTLIEIFPVEPDQTP